MKIAYFGYDFMYTCLQELLEEGHEIIKLYTFETDDHYNFNCKLLEIATNYSIPVSFDKPTIPEIEDLFVNQGCELIVVGCYIYKIPIIDHPQFKAVNIHPTLLPKGRGEWPLPLIILKNEKESGVTIHKLTDDLDAGPILIQDRFHVLPNEDLETLSVRSQLMAVKILRDLMFNFDYYWDNAVPQSEGEYWEYPSEESMTFDGNMTVDEISRIIRAFGKFDSLTSFLGKKWLVHDATCWKENHTYVPNTIVHVTNKEVLMAAVDGFVCIRYFEEDTE